MLPVRYLLLVLLALPISARAQGPAAVVAAEGRWWRIDTFGSRSGAFYPPAETLTRLPERDTVQSEGMYLVHKDGWQGTSYRFYTSRWKPLLDSTFDYAEPFEDGYALVMSGSGMNAIDTAGNFLLKGEIPGMHPANTVQSIRADRILVIQKEKDKICNCDLDGPHFGYRRRDGSWAIEPKFRSADLFYHGRAAASTDGILFGYLDAAGNWAIPPQFETARQFSSE